MPDDDTNRPSMIDQLGALRIDEDGVVHIGRVEVRENGTVMALRDAIVTIEPSLKDDVDHFIEQAYGLRRRYLTAIVSDPIDTCQDLDIETGSLKPETISGLAKGILDELKEQRERRFSWQQLAAGAVLSAFLGAFFGWLVTFLSMRGE